LFLESLEDRSVPTVVYNYAVSADTIFWVPGNSAGHQANQVQTGPISYNPSVLNSTTVYLDFWGTSWTEQNTAPLANDAKAIIQSKFFSLLSDYGFHGTISWGGYTIDNTETSDGNTGDPQNGQNLTTELQNLLNGKLATDPNLPTSGWLRPQDQKPQDSPIYIVVYDNGNTGNNSFANYTSSLVMNQINMGDQGGSADLFTDLLSHEVAERVSAGDETGIEMNATNAHTDGEFQDAQISDNEPDDGNYMYRLNGPGGQLVQAYWSLTYNGFVIPDGNSQVLYLNPHWSSNPLAFLGTSDLIINGGQQSSSGDTITLGDDSLGGVSVTLDNQLFQFDFGRITNIFITTSSGSSAVNFLATPSGTSTYINDLGNDSVVLGSTFGNQGLGTGYMGLIQGSVAVAAAGDIGEPLSTHLYLDDSGDQFAQYVTMSDGVIYYGTAAPVYFNPSDASTGGVTYVAIYGGSGGNTFSVDNTSKLYSDTFLSTGNGNDSVNVFATQGGLYDYNPGGNDVTNVGQGYTGNVNGFVEVYGSGSTSLYISDYSETIGRTVTMNDYSLQGLGAGGINWVASSSATGGVTYLEVDGGDGGNTFNVNTTSVLYTETLLNTGAANDTVNIYATQGGLDVYNPGGFDITNVGLGNMGSINGFVDAYGLGTTSLNLGDGSDTVARTVTMNDGSITGLGGGTGTISWTPTSTSTGGVAYLTVSGSTAGSTYNINNTSNIFGGTSLYTGAGNDTVNVAATKGSASTGGLYTFNLGGADSFNVGQGSVANINGIVSIVGFGSTSLTVDDHLNSTSRTATLAGDQLSGLGNAGTITYTSAVTAVTIDGPSVASTYDIQDTSAGTSVTVNGGVGRDAFNLGSGNSLDGIQGALTVNGGSGGANGLNANDSSSGSGQSYTLSNTTLSRSGIAPITYGSLATMNITGSGNDSLTLLTPVPLTVATSFSGGSGTNTLQGADASNLWTINGANSGRLDNVFFSNFQQLIGGNTTDTFQFTKTTASESSINGGAAGGTNKLDYSVLGSSFPVMVNLATSSAPLISGGFSNINVVAGSSDTANTLTAANTTNQWTINGNGADTVNTFTFAGMSHLVGGTGVDSFAFSSAGGKVLGINGGGAPAGQGDWLNYSALASSNTVTVNLATGSATNVNSGAAGAVTNIQNVIGSGTGTDILTGNSKGNILIGGSGANTLTGGSGGSLLIGGSGHGSVTGGASSDILIAGTTTYNATTTVGQNALMSILAELQSTDTFAQKVSDIINGNKSGGGSDLNGSNKLTWGGTNPTVKASAGAFTLSGDSSAATTADWYFANASSTITDFNDDGGKDEHNNNTIGVF
jgi:hypothetical protein